MIADEGVDCGSRRLSGWVTWIATLGHLSKQHRVEGLR